MKSRFSEKIQQFQNGRFVIEFDIFRLFVQFFDVYCGQHKAKSLKKSQSNICTHFSWNHT